MPHHGSVVTGHTGQAGDYQINFNPYSPTVIEGLGTIFEPLFYYNQLGKGDPKPQLGTDFTWNDTGTELTVNLRDDVNWSDGTEFTATDVVFTLDMVAKTPPSTAPATTAPPRQ